MYIGWMRGTLVYDNSLSLLQIVDIFASLSKTCHHGLNFEGRDFQHLGKWAFKGGIYMNPYYIKVLCILQD